LVETAIEVRDLVKVFGNISALSGLSFSVNQGEIYGLIGPNGAGKTTALRIISTLIKPTSGQASIFGINVDQDSEIRKIISYLPEEAGAYRNLSGREYLKFMASFYASKEEQIKEMVQEASKISGLGERLGDKTKTYSKGMNRRLLIARALMTRPRLAILDEPTASLDVLHAFHVRRIIQDYAKNQSVTVLLSSHNMLEVEFLCHRIALINEGKILVKGSPHDIIRKYDVGNLEDAFMEAIKVG